MALLLTNSSQHSHLISTIISREKLSYLTSSSWSSWLDGVGEGSRPGENYTVMFIIKFAGDVHRTLLRVILLLSPALFTHTTIPTISERVVYIQINGKWK